MVVWACKACKTLVADVAPRVLAVRAVSVLVLVLTSLVAITVVVGLGLVDRTRQGSNDLHF